MIRNLAAVDAHFHGCRGNAIRARIYVHVQQFEFVRPSRHAQNFLGNDRFDILIVNVFLFIGELFKAHKGAIHVFLAQIEAQVLQPFVEGVAPGVFAHYQAVAGDTNGLGRHDLVSLFVLEHPILVNARLMSERVIAHHRLVDRNRNTRDLRNQSGTRIELLAGDVRVEIEIVFTRPQRHYDLFQGGIAGAFADAVDRALDLPSTVVHRGKRIRHRQTQVVMTMGAPNHAVAAGGAFDQVRHQSAELRRDGVSGSIGHVDYSSAGTNDFAKDLNQKLRIAARSILSGKFNVIGKLLCVLYRLHRGFQYLLTRHAQFMLEVNIRSCDDRVNARICRAFDGFQGALNIAL